MICGWEDHVNKTNLLKNISTYTDRMFQSITFQIPFLKKLPMISLCNFYSYISRLLFIGCHFQIVEFIYKSFMRDERLFLCFIARDAYRTCITCVNDITFQIGYFTRSEPPHKKNRKHYAICNQAMQYTVLNDSCLNCV